VIICADSWLTLIMITLLAATGFTGQLVARELHRLGLPMRLAARNETKLRELAAEVGNPPLIVADVTRPETLGRIFGDTKVLITCAGPFTEMGEPVVAEAARRGVHYLDTTGEQHFIRLVFDRYSQMASERGAALVPAAAFEYALGGAAAALAAKNFQPCDEISVTYALAGFGASRGTKKSILHAISDPGFLYRDGRRVPLRSGAERRRIQTPDGKQLTAVSFAGGEVIQAPAHIETRAVTTLMALGEFASLMMPFGAGLAVLLMHSPFGGLIKNQIDSGSFGPTPTERAQTSFTILCEARRGNDRRTVTAAGRDPYGLTAVVIVALARHLLEKGTENVGAIAPAMVASERLIVAATEESGVEWRDGN
jgi:short subunit dehydrogenase-like uncharacterized protein